MFLAKLMKPLFTPLLEAPCPPKFRGENRQACWNYDESRPGQNQKRQSNSQNNAA